MNKRETEYWKWKNTIIDFDAISEEKDEHCDYITKKDIIFTYLGVPDNEVHEWYNGGFSSEYNTALRYAKQLNLVEDYIDYEGKIDDLQQRIDEAIEYIKDKEAIINTDKIRIFDLFEISEQGYIDKLLSILKGKDKEC